VLSIGAGAGHEADQTGYAHVHHVPEEITLSDEDEGPAPHGALLHLGGGRAIRSPKPPRTPVFKAGALAVLPALCERSSPVLALGLQALVRHNVRKKSARIKLGRWEVRLFSQGFMIPSPFSRAWRRRRNLAQTTHRKPGFPVTVFLPSTPTECP